jgi:hypothetical protein
MPSLRTSVDVAPFRQALIDAIKPHLPRGWRFEPYRTSVDAIDRTTVLTSLTAIARHPAAPQAKLQVDYTVSVFSPIQGNQADKNLDGDILALIAIIDANPILSWSSAKQVDSGDSQYLGYDIAVTIIANKTINKEP